MQKRINSYEELVNWANRANVCVRVNEKCDLQDEFAHSNVEDLNKFISQSIDTADRRLVMFSAFKIMGDSQLENCVKIWCRKTAQEIIDKEETKIQAKWDELGKYEKGLVYRHDQMEDARKHIFRKIADLRKRISMIVHENNRLFREYETQKRRRQRWQEIAATHADNSNKFLQIKELLKGE